MGVHGGHPGVLLTIAGAVISKLDPTLLTNGSPMTEAARVYADYLFARNLALAVVVLLLLAIRARRMLAGLMVLVALIQLLDVGDDLARGAWLLIPGVLVFAIVFLLEYSPAQAFYCSFVHITCQLHTSKAMNKATHTTASFLFIGTNIRNSHHSSELRQ